jgi:hypothetical protein
LFSNDFYSSFVLSPALFDSGFGISQKNTKSTIT